MPLRGKMKLISSMKDRIRQIMESKHMTQQVFADFIGTTPATLSGIFNDRTRPTINIVEAIKKKIPDINTDWLLFGQGDMYQVSSESSPSVNSVLSSTGTADTASVKNYGEKSHQPGLFDFAPSPSSSQLAGKNSPSATATSNSVISTHPEILLEELKNINKPKRHVTEIRVYYDDQTWESFVPSKHD